jgi:hypothetical protein
MRAAIDHRGRLPLRDRLHVDQRDQRRHARRRDGRLERVRDLGPSAVEETHIGQPRAGRVEDVAGKLHARPGPLLASARARRDVHGAREPEGGLAATVRVRALLTEERGGDGDDGDDPASGPCPAPHDGSFCRTKRWVRNDTASSAIASPTIAATR